HCVYAYTDDEFAHAARRSRKIISLGKIRYRDRKLLLEVSEMVPCPSRHNRAHLRGEFSFCLWLLPISRPRLDSSRRPVRALKFVHSSRGHVASENQRDGSRHLPACGGPARSNVRSKLYTRAHQPCSSFHWPCSPPRAKTQSSTAGHQSPRNSCQLSQHDLQRAPAFRAWRRDLFANLRHHPRA